MNVGIVGAGIFGCCIALELAKLDFVSSVDVYEKNDDILQEASRNNQHRYHLGYHYPRSQKTIEQILLTNKCFDEMFFECTKSIFRNVYFIAKDGSKTDTEKFERTFCSHDMRRVDLTLYKNFIKCENIESGFLVKERCLNNFAIKSHIIDLIKNEKKISVKLNYDVKRNDSILTSYDFLVNCTYVNLDLTEDVPVKYELCILPVVKNPNQFDDYAFTVMDGEFPSLYPTENENLFTVSHVKKTPFFKTDSFVELQKFRKMLSNYDIFRAGQDVIDASSDFFLGKFEIVDNYLTYKVKLKDDRDDLRTSGIFFNKNVVTILQGKITTAPSIAKEISEYVRNYVDR